MTLDVILVNVGAVILIAGILWYFRMGRRR